ncbi:hypothetical protein BKE38_14690 [Pseudoroseomonas deserti]|uniref:Uncharacterized protein n=1 Tax=Teichococcus deserti TaxID=1817963 RepID=A0A1V2H2V2_9PROT|nr:hypothetical protein [Pseudoroseomonas deserti]ONG52310.1 hypothetical protein BKE38_14690 [Pseudoroseomonas deserti]
MPRLAVDRLFRLHCGLILAVLAGHLLSRLLYARAGRESSLSNVLNMLEETSIPTVVSTAGLLAAALAALLIALSARASGERLARSWFFVAACLAFMALDEGAALHDRLTFLLQGRFALGGVFYLGWVLPYLLLAGLCAVLCLPLAWQLPRRTLARILLAGAVFAGAALGLEMVESAVIHAAAGPGVALRDVDLAAINRTPLMTALVTLEELGELLGIALLLRALLLHLVQDRGITAIRLETAQRPAALAARQPAG